jgi:cofilin
LLNVTQASGVEVADVSITTYQQLKLGKKFKYILLTLNDDLSEIVVKKTSGTLDYEAFVEDLPKDQCCWAVYDFEFEMDGKRNKLCFVSW